ncbi:MAG: arginine--tRNA ligase [Candidatus Liptonbacteria bacterium]|nr:arginine--tRNA ligase [Candidatus Liptonbacteria bacterium]
MMIEKIANLIKEATGEEEVKVMIPEQNKFGHYSTNLAFVIAKYQEIPVVAVAKEIREKILRKAPKNFFERIDIAANGFLNFFLSKETLEEEINKILCLKNRYGYSDKGKGQVIIIDYSSPNVAKPLTIGHFRSTIIGQALVNLFKFQGYKVIGDNHLGDWGAQFGALLVAFKKWKNEKELKENLVGHLVSLYVRFHKEAENNEKLLDEAKEETKKLQEGNKENRKLWKLFITESLKEFNKTYKRLGIKFSLTLGESFYQPMLNQVVKEALEKKVAVYNEGAVKIFFQEKELIPPMVIQKSDDSFLYTTTDLAAIKYRVSRWHLNKILYVVANEQTLHFNQVFRAAEMLGYAPKNILVHIKFGMLLGEEGKKMSTRKGEFIKLEEVLNKAVEKAGQINKEAAEKVGIGAIKYYDLSHYRESDIVFDWDRMLDLKGNSGPYLQYTYSRLKSILKKALVLPFFQNSNNFFSRKIDISLASSEAEKNIIRQLIYFPDAVAYAAETYSPNHLADYLYKLANCINVFYEKESVLNAENKIKENRLSLVSASSQVLKTGLDLLGIKVVEKM